MHTVIRVIQDTTNLGDWEEIDTPSTIGKCVNRTTVIVFSDMNGIVYQGYVPVDVKKINWTVQQWIDSLDVSKLQQGDLELVEGIVTQEPIDRSKYTIRRSKLGWHPESVSLESMKDSILLSIEGQSGIDFGKNKLYTLDGYLALNNYSRHGVYIPSTYEQIQKGMTEIGVIDFNGVGDIELMPYNPDNVTYTDDRGFYYQHPTEDGDPVPGSTFLHVFLGGLYGIDDKVEMVNDGLIRCPISKIAKITSLLNYEFNVGVDLGLEKLTEGGYNTDSLMSLDSLKIMLASKHSFMIRIDSANVKTDSQIIHNVSRHILHSDDHVALPLKNRTGQCMPYEYDHIDGVCVYKIPSNDKLNYKMFNWSEWDGIVSLVSLDPYLKREDDECSSLFIKRLYLKTVK